MAQNVWDWDDPAEPMVGRRTRRRRNHQFFIPIFEVNYSLPPYYFPNQSHIIQKPESTQTLHNN